MNEQNSNGTRLLRSADVAAMLNISKAFAYKLMRSGKLPTIRMGKAVRVRLEDVNQYIAENRGDTFRWR